MDRKAYEAARSIIEAKLLAKDGTEEDATEEIQQLVDLAVEAGAGGYPLPGGRYSVNRSVDFPAPDGGAS